MVGRAYQAKFETLVAVPPGVITLTVPEVPAATTAVIWVAELTVKDAAAVLPKVTLTADDVKLVDEKFVPVITTEVEFPPLAGVNEVMVGMGDTLMVNEAE